MYAIIEVGSKQYNVQKGDILDVEKLSVEKGKEFTIDKVLLVSADKKFEVGQPYLKGARVTAELLAEVKAKKVISFRYRRRKASHWTKGHRQKLSRIKIKAIDVG